MDGAREVNTRAPKRWVDTGPPARLAGTIVDTRRTPVPRQGPPVKLVVALGVDAWLRFRRVPGDFGGAAAELFVKALTAADAPYEDGSGTSRTGYSAAWHALSKEARARRPFDEFYDAWSRLIELHGPIVDDRIVSGGGSRSRPLLAILRMGKSARHPEDLTEVKVEMDVRSEGGRPVVSDYAVTTVPRSEAR
jgi:hypothetical protein